MARLSAGMGVLTLGSAGGLVLYTLVTLASAASPAEIAVASATEPAEGMSGISYLTLAGMIALLVAGLGWCFYRAIRASAARNAQQQKAEM